MAGRAQLKSEPVCGCALIRPEASKSYESCYTVSCDTKCRETFIVRLGESRRITFDFSCFCADLSGCENDDAYFEPTIPLNACETSSCVSADGKIGLSSVEMDPVSGKMFVLVDAFDEGLRNRDTYTLTAWAKTPLGEHRSLSATVAIGAI